MLCRVADDLFWMSRYVERAIAVGRIIDVTSHLELDAGQPGAGGAFWTPLLRYAEGAALDAATSPDRVRHYLSVDQANQDSLVSCIRRAREAAQRIRESISSEMWEQINGLHLSLSTARLATADRDPYAFYRWVREGAQFFQGLAGNTLAHDEAWAFMSLGEYLERADAVARLLLLESHLLQGPLPGTDDSTVRWLAVLRSCGSAEAYARYYSLRVEPARVLEFLLFNPVFPQALRFSLAAAHDALGLIGTSSGSGMATPPMRGLSRLCTLLETATVDEVIESGLTAFLSDVRERIRSVVSDITRLYMRDQAPPSQKVGVARAALMMAAQQQQQARV